jgi:hypothetical protein
MEIPTIREELSRKSLEALERLVIDRAKGAITEAQFSTGMNVLWDIVAGLTDKDFIEIISTVKVNKNDDSFKRRRMMICRDHWILTTVDTTALSVTVLRNGGSPPTEMVCDSIEEALAKATKIHEKAGLSGYAPTN